MLWQTVEEPEGMERSQEFPVKPLCKWKHHIRNLRRTHTQFESHFFSFFCHHHSLFLSPSKTHASLDTVLSSLSGIYRRKKKRGPSHERDCFAFGHVVHSRTGKFSGLDPDGTCGSVGSQHCYVSSGWGWRFPCQCRVSTTKVQPLFSVDSRPGGLKWW